MFHRHANFRARLSVLASISLACVATTLQAQEDDADDEADHEALREIRRVAEEAINTNQLDLLKPYLADNFSVVTYTDREFSDFDVFKEQWQKTRDEVVGDGSYTTTLNPVRSRIIGDIAIAHGNSDNVLTTGGGETFEFTSHWSAVLQKVDGDWKLVRAHSSLSPFDNPMLKAGVTKRLWQVGLLGLVVGLLVGGLGAALLTRSRRRDNVEQVS